MSTTHVQSLPNVRGRMSYTEFGEGKRRRAHLENGTDRIAAQMGDAASREDFIVYCEGQKHRHPNAVNEGYELRISWATDELDPSKADDIQRGMEYAYTLCHELAPDSMCWVTMHVDGEGGCVHAHATIANHDARTGQVINKGDTSLYAPRVKAVNDELSRACGFQVLGADREMSLWEQKRETFQPDSFDRRLGDRVAGARDRSSTLDEFRRNLGLSGVTLKETTKTDGKTGEVTTGWSYKAVDEWGPKRRTRKRRASNLADDLTREGIEAYFDQKQRGLEAQQQDAPAPEVTPDMPETAEPAAQPPYGFRSRRVRPRPGVRVGDGVRPSEGAHPPLTRGGQAPHGRALSADCRGGQPPGRAAGEAARGRGRRKARVPCLQGGARHPAKPVPGASGRHARVRQGGARRL